MGHSSDVKSVKSVIARVCKIGDVRKDRVKPSMNKSMWWCVIHAKESVLSDLETKWDQVRNIVHNLYSCEQPVAEGP